MSAADVDRLVVLGHDAGRTGAPSLLLSLLRWLTGSRRVEVDLVLRRGGPLMTEFSTLGRVLALRPAHRRGAVDLIEAALAEGGAEGLSARLPALERLVRGRRPSMSGDLVLVNGIGGATLLDLVPDTTPVALLLHELDVGIDRSLAQGRQEALWRRCDRIVTVSAAVADALAARPGVDPDRLCIARGFVEPRSPSVVTPVRQREMLGLPEPDRPLVGAVGAGHWRKGIDLFVQLAEQVGRRSPVRPRFVWVGPVDDERRVRHDIDQAGLTEEVSLVGAVDDTAPWYDGFDVMVSTAREDPFPLVGLEAGLAGLPVVSFDNGGLAELLADGRGDVVGPLDVAGMADRVQHWLSEPGLARAMGARLRCHVEIHHVTERGAPLMWQAIAGVASEARR